MLTLAIILAIAFLLGTRCHWSILILANIFVALAILVPTLSSWRFGFTDVLRLLSGLTALQGAYLVGAALSMPKDRDS
jgi:hypothetical protein